MRHFTIAALAFTAVLGAATAPALARGHGHGHAHFGGHPHFGHAHFGGHHHGGPRFGFVGHGWHPRPGWRTYGVVHHRWRPGYVYAYGAPVYHRPVGGCTTTRRVGWTSYGWRKIVTTRTCIVP